MNVPVQVSFRGVSQYESIQKWAQAQAVKLEEACSHLSSVRLAVEKVQKYQESGRPYRVRLDLTVPPGKEIVIKREPGGGSIHETLQDELETVFHVAFRRLSEIKDIQQGKVKKHPHKEVNGVVTKIFRDRSYGFITAFDGHEVYFHKNSLRSGNFDRLQKTTGVNYVEELGEKGPQASAVRVIEIPEL